MTVHISNTTESDGLGSVALRLAEKQAARLDAILPWAECLGELSDVWCPSKQQVHLRPSGTGIRIVDLHPSRPQLDRGKLACLTTTKGDFLRLVTQTARGVPGRSTPEKRLQSWLLREAYAAERRLVHFAPDMVFVTDEQRFPVTERKDNVCDLLAVRMSAQGVAPVVLELKSKRDKGRLIDQVQGAAAVVDAQRDRFAQLFSAILGRTVALDQPCERWIVWPSREGTSVEPHSDGLAERGIRVVTYTEQGNAFRFSVGPAVGENHPGP